MSKAKEEGDDMGDAAHTDSESSSGTHVLDLKLDENEEEWEHRLVRIYSYTLRGPVLNCLGRFTDGTTLQAWVRNRKGLLPTCVVTGPYAQLICQQEDPWIREVVCRLRKIEKWRDQSDCKYWAQLYVKDRRHLFDFQHLRQVLDDDDDQDMGLRLEDIRWNVGRIGHGDEVTGVLSRAHNDRLDGLETYRATLSRAKRRGNGGGTRVRLQIRRSDPFSSEKSPRLLPKYLKGINADCMQSLIVAVFQKAWRLERNTRPIGHNHRGSESFPIIMVPSANTETIQRKTLVSFADNQLGSDTIHAHGKVEPSKLRKPSAVSGIIKRSTSVVSSGIIKSSTMMVSSEMTKPSTKMVSSEMTKSSTEIVSSEITNPSTKMVSSEMTKSSTEIVSSEITKPSTKMVQSEMTKIFTTNGSSEISKQRTTMASFERTKPSTTMVSSEIAKSCTTLMSSEITKPTIRMVSSDIAQPSTTVMPSKITKSSTMMVSCEITKPSLTTEEVISHETVELAATRKASVTFQSPVTRKPSVTFQLPVTRKPSVTFQLPVTRKQSVTFQLPVTRKPSVTFQLPDTRKPSVTFQLPDTRKPYGTLQLSDTDISELHDTVELTKSTNRIDPADKADPTPHRVGNILVTDKPEPWAENQPGVIAVSGVTSGFFLSMGDKRRKPRKGDEHPKVFSDVQGEVEGTLGTGDLKPAKPQKTKKLLSFFAYLFCCVPLRRNGQKANSY